MVSKLSNDSVLWFMNDLTSRIVAESGIPSDRYHLGKIILQSLKDYPDAILQINGATGDSETNGSVLNRTILCATCLRNFGLEIGDVIVLMAPSDLDLAIPFYAALFIGVTVAPVDRTLSVRELKATFAVSEPKIVFCLSEKATEVQLALNEIDSSAQIVTFDTGDYLCNFEEFLQKYGDDTSPFGSFKATDFDAEDTGALLLATSGTTGVPKAAEATHKNFTTSIPYLWSRSTTFPGPTRMALIGSPIQWLTAVMHFLASPILKYTRLQSSLPLTQEHAYYLINTYKPSFTVMSPTFMTTLMSPDKRDECDFTCFDLIMLGGSAVPPELIETIKDVSPSTEVFNAYGMSELTGLAFHSDYPPPGSSGKPMGCFQYRIVDIDTQENIEEPNVPGELWLKGPAIFKGYYKNEEATAETFVDGWFKTGDMFYRDENYNFFFCERIKLLLKYKSYQISPVEVESVIRQHPGVLDVAVTGIPDPECGDLPVACVVLRAGYDVSADDIKELVQGTLSDSKQLKGGVVFLNEIPMTASTKVHRRKLKEIVMVAERY
ncbi:luciferin 4-monooxygenase-like [Colias croceus]|uniref:luciferin 4-monooxygenase-like n=1 Tax=Colias crocea TaxID=72248 RepID=UPI001E27D462|nr:luciferin 4-monooxygenase-like [Colias croceus]